MFCDCTRLLSDISVYLQDTSTMTLKHQDSSLRVVLVMELTTQVSHLRVLVVMMSLLLTRKSNLNDEIESAMMHELFGSDSEEDEACATECTSCGATADAGAVSCSVVSCSAVQCCAVPCSAVQCHAVLCSVVQCCAVSCMLRVAVCYGAMKRRSTQSLSGCRLGQWLWQQKRHAQCWRTWILQPFFH